MKNQFTQEEIKNILALINVAPIKGQEAFIVAQLQMKLNNLLTTTDKVQGAVESPAEFLPDQKDNGETPEPAKE